MWEYDRCRTNREKYEIAVENARLLAAQRYGKASTAMVKKTLWTWRPGGARESFIFTALPLSSEEQELNGKRRAVTASFEEREERRSGGFQFVRALEAHWGTLPVYPRVNSRIQSR